MATKKVSSQTLTSSQPSPYVCGIDELRGVEWATTYNYSVRFDNMSAPFDKWMPAFDVIEPLFSVISMPLNAGHIQNLKMPIGISYGDISLQLYETSQCVIEQWLTTWRNKVVSTTGVGCLGDVVQKLTVSKLDQQKKVPVENTYFVYPSGEVTLQFSSKQNDVRILRAEFAVVGLASSK